MGGEGSGRKPNPENLFKYAKDTTQPVGDLLAGAPNYGGIKASARRDKGFTEGSVVFVDANNEFTEDNSNLFWDDTENRLGIGTTSPSAPLQIGNTDTGNVSGDQVSETLTLQGDGASQDPIFQARGDNLIEFGKSAGWDVIIYLESNRGDPFLIKKGDNVNTLTFSKGNPDNHTSQVSTILTLNTNGRVGIVTTSPAAQLDIDQSSTTAAIPVLRLDQADVSEEMIEFETTIGEGNAIEAVGAKTLTTTHFIKVTLPGGLTRYIPAGTIA